MKILLIEDRIVRKELFLDRSEIDLSKYTFLREITPDEFRKIKSSIKNADKTFFDGYDLIITHKSAFTLNEQDILARGQRYGFIRFGSRVDVYLPLTAHPLVTVGDKVSATETILAEF
jgi:phosphatidylserine decarboxylase